MRRRARKNESRMFLFCVISKTEDFIFLAATFHTLHITPQHTTLKSSVEEWSGADLRRENVISIRNENIGENEKNEFVARFDNMKRLHFDTWFEGFLLKFFVHTTIIERVL